MFTGGRSSGGTVSSPWIVASGLWSASSESSFGISMPPFIVLSSASYQPPIVNGAPSVVVGSPSIAASLTGWRSRDLAPGPVADDDLRGRGQRGEAERHDEAGAVVRVALAAQVGRGVHAGDDEARDDVAGQVHVDQLVPHVPVEQCGEGLRVDHLAVADAEAGAGRSSSR